MLFVYVASVNGHGASRVAGIRRTEREAKKLLPVARVWEEIVPDISLDPDQRTTWRAQGPPGYDYWIECWKVP